MAVADFDRDRIPDLAVASIRDGSASILRGTGKGVFAAPISSPVGAGPQAIVTADFNGDGKVDIATANFDSGDVGVLLNTSH